MRADAQTGCRCICRRHRMGEETATSEIGAQNGNVRMQLRDKVFLKMGVKNG